MSSSGSKALVVRYRKAALAAAGAGDVTALDEMVAEDAVFLDPRASAATDRAAHQQRWQELVGAFTDLAFEVHELLEAGDRVIARWSMRGIHGDVYAGIGPTERPVSPAGITTYRVAGGRIAEAWSSHDELGMLEQPGSPCRTRTGDDVDPPSELGMIM